MKKQVLTIHFIFASAKWTLLREASPGAGVEADISTDPVTYWPGSNHVMRAMPLNDTTFICGGCMFYFSEFIAKNED